MSKKSASTILFSISLPSTKRPLLTAEQLEAICAIVVGAECIQTNYERDEDGKYGDVKTLGTIAPEDVSVTVITEQFYSAIDLVTKVRRDAGKA